MSLSVIHFAKQNDCSYLLCPCTNHLQDDLSLSLLYSIHDRLVLFYQLSLRLVPFSILYVSAHSNRLPPPWEAVNKHCLSASVNVLRMCLTSVLSAMPSGSGPKLFSLTEIRMYGRPHYLIFRFYKLSGYLFFQNNL